MAPSGIVSGGQTGADRAALDWAISRDIPQCLSTGSAQETESAVRLTHYDSGIVVSMQDEKSQHKNLAKALRILKSRLYDQRQQQENEKRASERKSLVGSGSTISLNSAAGPP